MKKSAILQIGQRNEAVTVNDMSSWSYGGTKL